MFHFNRRSLGRLRQLIDALNRGSVAISRGLSARLWLYLSPLHCSAQARHLDSGAMAHDWFVKRGEKTYGPFTSAQLKKLAGEGKVSPSTEIRLGENGGWSQASRVKGLFAASQDSSASLSTSSLQASSLPPVPPPPVAKPTPARPLAAAACRSSRDRYLPSQLPARQRRCRRRILP